MENEHNEGAESNSTKRVFKVPINVSGNPVFLFLFLSEWSDLQ